MRVCTYHLIKWSRVAGLCQGKHMLLSLACTSHYRCTQAVLDQSIPTDLQTESPMPPVVRTTKKLGDNSVLGPFELLKIGSQHRGMHCILEVNAGPVRSTSLCLGTARMT